MFCSRPMPAACPALLLPTGPLPNPNCFFSAYLTQTSWVRGHSCLLCAGHRTSFGLALVIVD